MPRPTSLAARPVEALIVAGALLVGGALAAQAAESRPITIVAAENFYGDLAHKIAGDNAEIVSILSNPDQDPHLFEADASTAKALAGARIVIANGADYDPWMDKLLSVSSGADRTTIVAADLTGHHAGDNPHLWYDPATMTKVAVALGDDLARIDPGHGDAYRANVESFKTSLKPLDARIADMKAKFAGQPVTATEPVFGYMAELLGLDMRNEAFQTAVMNGTEPSPRSIAAFETDLTGHKVRALLYNSQADDQAVVRLVEIARKAKVPVVGVSETEPAAKDYAGWMSDQLGALDAALSSGRS